MIINKLSILLFFPFLTFSCTSEEKGKLPDSAFYNNTGSALTQEQQAAFDALNTLQTSTDEMNRLYSTFVKPSYPADTSFEVSQSELRAFMEQFIYEHCQNLSPEIQNQLAKTAVLAQKKYTVLHCTENRSDIDYDKGLPMTGTWVIPNILNRRDVILVW
ncbi:MAG: hypothetical protein KDC34_02870 [Saprospiraceae bacterium]|nr:hypothetical protein [Saprospiraceae bacterium]